MPIVTVRQGAIGTKRYIVQTDDGRLLRSRNDRPAELAFTSTKDGIARNLERMAAEMEWASAIVESDPAGHRGGHFMNVITTTCRHAPFAVAHILVYGLLEVVALSGVAATCIYLL